MLSAELLVHRPEFALRLVHCHEDHIGWSAPEAGERHGVVLVRSGGFRRRGPRGEMWADRALGYLVTPGDEERFAHPAGGDECTAIHVSPRLWRAVSGPSTARRAAAVSVDSRLELDHRLLLRSARSGDVDFAVAERLLRLLAAATHEAGVAGGDPRSDTRHDATPTCTDRALADAAREALTAEHPSARGLLPLAELLGVSPYRLSRVFHRHVGVPLTRYRNRLRVGAALHRLENGEPSLAALANDLGFADQAHLTRTVRAEVGETPHRLRALLAGPAG
ncbi:MAG TPA: helix-turn-helix transcriptional regulator [Micromonosporaceae bacterium]|jgi:AraC-like DNA-binding protein